jgi:hypothetical protein
MAVYNICRIFLVRVRVPRKFLIKERAAACRTLSGALR